MDYYVDIRVLPNIEISKMDIMNSLFERFHLALVRARSKSIGISFPEFDKTLGSIMRIHGCKEDLANLMSSNWLKYFDDYIHLSSILIVPLDTQYRVVRRRQTKSNIKRVLRRSVRKGWISSEEANNRSHSLKKKRLDLPFLRIKSRSSDQTFCLFIEHGPKLDSPVDGSFSYYGLSSEASVPWF